MKPARYFPVQAGPLRMRAGLSRFGTDFGNGTRDAQYFQIDDELGHALRSKREPAIPGAAVPFERHRVLAGAQRERVHARVLEWLLATLAREHPERFDGRLPVPPGPPPLSPFDAIGRSVQEDLVIVRRLPEGGDEASMLHVCFPSGWCPVRAAGQGFAAIHAPVPEFADDGRQVRSLLSAMIDRGPYVRFVWTLAADDLLDHHPDQRGRRSWAEAERGWLRIERQVTLGFPDVGASLFLIRTYLRAFESLEAAEGSALRAAIAAMPEAVRRYKGILGHEARVLGLVPGGHGDR